MNELRRDIIFVPLAHVKSDIEQFGKATGELAEVAKDYHTNVVTATSPLAIEVHFDLHAPAVQEFLKGFSGLDSEDIEKQVNEEAKRNPAMAAEVAKRDRVWDLLRSPEHKAAYLGRTGIYDEYGYCYIASPKLLDALVNAQVIEAPVAEEVKKFLAEPLTPQSLFSMEKKGLIKPDDREKVLTQIGTTAKTR